MIAPFRDFPATRPAPRITLKDIATASGVSTATVSLALRNSPRISRQRKTLIAQVCSQLGYVRDARLSELMSHLRKGAKESLNGAIAVLATGHYDSHEEGRETRRSILKGIGSQAEGEGYSLNVFHIAQENLRPKRLRQILISRGVTGIVILPGDDHSLLDGFDFSGFSVVCLGYEFQLPDFHRVCPNYLKMMDQLLNEAIENGYRRFGIVPKLKRALLRNRMLNASLDYQLMDAPGAERVPDYEGDLSDRNALRSWLMKYQPDMILGDRKTLAALELLGMRTPEDFGFASLDLAGLRERVSGLDTPYELMGEEALRLLISQMNRGEKGPPQKPETVVVDSSFHSAETTRFRCEDSLLLEVV